MTDSETATALRRAGKRALFHLLRGAVEALRAVEVIVDELAAVGRDSKEKTNDNDRTNGNDDNTGTDRPRRVRIDVE